MRFLSMSKRNAVGVGRGSKDLPPYRGLSSSCYRICIETPRRKYVAWKAWEGHVLTDDEEAACVFKTRRLAHQVARSWTHLGQVYVEKIQAW